MLGFTIIQESSCTALWVDVKAMSNGKEFVGRGLLDTGAARSALTADVKTFLNLTDSTDKHDVNTANGPDHVPYYLIDITLCDSVDFSDVEFDLFKSYNGGPDFLIGMDIISRGNLAVTNYSGTLMVSFESPSRGNIDFSRL